MVTETIKQKKEKNKISIPLFFYDKHECQKKLKYQ